MNKQALTVLLAALAFSGGARAIPFLDVSGDATGIAVTADAPAGFDSLSGSPAGGPLTANAASVGTTDVATAGAIAGLGLLTTSADVSADGIGSAVATAHFTGSFVNTAAVSLGLDFTRLDTAGGSGAASTTLFVSLTSNGVSLFSDYVQGPWQFHYTPVLGTTSLLDLLLTSEASAAFVTPGVGNASAFGLVSFANPVPEASTWLLLSLGLGVVAAARGKAVRQPVPA